MEIDIYVADGLYCVSEHKSTTLVGNLGYFGDRLDCANLVICEHNCDYRGFFCYCGAEVVKGNDTVLIYGEVGHGEAFLFKRTAGVKYCGMLDSGCNDVSLALLCKTASSALDRPVIRFCAAGCEVNLRWVASKNGCYSLSGVGEDVLCLISLCMGAGGVAPRL